MSTQGKFVNDMSIAKSKILTRFFQCKNSLSPLETILTIPGELEYLEGLVKLARKWKDEKTQQVMYISSINAIFHQEGMCQQEPQE